MRPDRARRGAPVDPAPRRRARAGVVLVVVLVAAAALWATRDRWLPSDPYQATPAESFPVGEAGFVPPPARPVDGMSAEAVAGALDRVRRALVAAYLDPRVLVQHDPTPLLSLLAPDSAAVVGPRLDAGEYGTTVVRLRPGTTLAATPRVSGRLSFGRVDWAGRPALDVTSNYVVAYAFASPRDVVVVHAETHWMFPLGGALRPESDGMFLGRTTGYWQGMDCAAASRGLTAPATHAGPGRPGPMDPDTLDSYFDPNRPLDIHSACH